MGGHLHLRGAAGLDGELGEVVTDVVGQCLRVRGRSGPAAPDVIVQLGDFIGGAVGNVCSRGDARIYVMKLIMR